jgi:prophage regulatory protein
VAELLEHLHGIFVDPKSRRSKRKYARRNTKAIVQENNNAEPPPPSLRFLSKKQVLEKIPVTAPTIWKWVREGKFPRPRALGPNKTVWIEAEVDAWMQAQPVPQYKP